MTETELKSLGFSTSIFDECFYLKSSDNGFILLLLIVDNMALAWDKQALLDNSRPYL